MRPYLGVERSIDMRSGFRPSIFVLVTLLALMLVASAGAQQINFPNFASPLSNGNMQFNGATRIGVWQSNVVLRLTDGSPNPEQATSFFKLQQPVNQGFSTWFKFQIHNPTICCSPADGFAFVVQDVTASDPSYGASGSGLHSLGAGGGGVGYSGLNNNLAIEFDIHADPWDPNSNHVAIQTCGANLVNTPVHLPGTYTVGQNHNVTSCLLSSGAITQNLTDMIGGTCNGSSCTDGAPHQAVIQYTPPTPPQTQGLLQVWLDPTFVPDTHTPTSAPILSVPYNITYSSSNHAGLALNSGAAWVGFTGSQPANEGTTQDVLAWEFTPHAPVMITKTIPPGGTENDFIFGNYQQAVTYPPGFTNPQGITMTVVATPVNRNTFYTTRLLGTQFANCVVQSVTCNLPSGQPIACPTEDEDTIAICSQFTTTDPITATNADYLKADPIGSNNWVSIFTAFIQNDPIVSGKGRSFSDLVATFIRNHGDEVPPPTPPLDEVIPRKLLTPGTGGICPPITR
jgi:hypothetical protein